METNISNLDSAYDAGYRKGLKRGTIATLIGAAFSLVAFDIIQDTQPYKDIKAGLGFTSSAEQAGDSVVSPVSPVGPYEIK